LRKCNHAYALAFFTKESTGGASLANGNLASHNFGNILWTYGYPTLDNVWRAYPTWTDGMEDWFKLIKNNYVAAGLHPVDQILPVYAPESENDTKLYISQVKSWVANIMWS
jgi:hypothetical protein